MIEIFVNNKQPLDNPPRVVFGHGPHQLVGILGVRVRHLVTLEPHIPHEVIVRTLCGLLTEPTQASPEAVSLIPLGDMEVDIMDSGGHRYLQRQVTFLEIFHDIQDFLESDIDITPESFINNNFELSQTFCELFEFPGQLLFQLVHLLHDVIALVPLVISAVVTFAHNVFILGKFQHLVTATEFLGLLGQMITDVIDSP